MVSPAFRSGKGSFPSLPNPQPLTFPFCSPSLFSTTQPPSPQLYVLKKKRGGETSSDKKEDAAAISRPLHISGAVRSDFIRQSLSISEFAHARRSLTATVWFGSVSFWLFHGYVTHFPTLKSANEMFSCHFVRSVRGLREETSTRLCLLWCVIRITMMKAVMLLAKI